MNEDWYKNLVQDCGDIIGETVYITRQALIECKHAIGQRIFTDPYFKKIQGQKAQHSIIQKLAVDIGISSRDAYYCVQFYEKFPNLSTLLQKSKEQKNLSWNKIIRNYLPTKTQKDEVCLHENTITICQGCRIKI